MEQNSIKIRLIIDQISINNRQHQSLESSEAGLEASWAVLGFSKRLGHVLEASLIPLGRSWAEKGGQHGSNLPPKTELKSIRNRSQNRSMF